MAFDRMTDRSKRRAMSVLDAAGKIALTLAIVAGFTGAHDGLTPGWSAACWLTGALLLVISGACIWVSVSIELSR